MTFLVGLGILLPAGLPLLGADPSASSPAAGTQKPRMAPLDRSRLRSFLQTRTKSVDDDLTTVASPLDDSTSYYKVINVEFTSAEARQRFKTPQGATVFHHFDRFADVFLEEEDALETYTRSPEVRWVDVAGIVEAPPPPDDTTRKGEKPRPVDRYIAGGLNGLTGKGVVVVVIDTGIDFRHPDFITEDGDGRPTSRLLYLWDTLNPPVPEKPGKKAPLSYPNGVSIGTLYKQEELTAELRGSAMQIPLTDTNGHGTACAGIAAGNGRAAQGAYAGVAPQADLIGIRIGEGPGLSSSYLLNAVCAWVDEQMKGRPVVISCSFADHRGGHDGQRVGERQLSARFGPDRKGRVICVAAGNEGELGLHARIRHRGQESPGKLEWVSKKGGRIALFADVDNGDDLEVVPGSGSRIEISRYQHGLSSSVVIEFDVPPRSRGSLSVFSKSGALVQEDAYVAADRGGTELLSRNVQHSRQIGTPGTAVNVITVGSYDFKDEFNSPRGAVRLGSQRTREELQIGQLSSYSNRGPLRKGKVIKPDLVAPGQYFTAPAPGGIRVKLPDASGKYRLFNGTSAATPYAAGVFALMLQRKPDLTLGEIRRLLEDCEALREAASIAQPDERWGYGKLNYDAARRLLDAVRP
jgi:subtilisin family serine protease